MLLARDIRILMTDPDQNADTLDLIPLQDLSASVSVLSKRKKRTRQESVEWNTVRITKEDPNNRSLGVHSLWKEWLWWGDTGEKPHFEQM